MKSIIIFLLLLCTYLGIGFAGPGEVPPPYDPTEANKLRTAFGPIQIIFPNMTDISGLSPAGGKVTIVIKDYTIKVEPPDSPSPWAPPAASE